MKTLTDQLSNYAAYHRDRRNIATHFVGIPLIMLAVAVLLSRPVFAVAGLPLSPAVLVVLGAALYYWALDRRFGAIMSVLLAVNLWLGAWFAAQTTSVWLGGGLGMFVVGWVIQFIGHWYEGKKPAFVDDLIGLLIGPLFVVAEVGFALGLRDEVRRDIEARVGPTVIRDRSAPAPAAQ